MSTDLLYSDELRTKLYAGVEKLTDAVKVTMGPRGRNVIIGRGTPHITKDGVTVAASIVLEDPVENLGSELVKQVSLKTAQEAGDGTTTATVLAHSIFKEGLRNVTAGANPILLKRGMDKVSELIVQNLRDLSKEVETKDEIRQIATISANSDADVGDIIAEAMSAVGKLGVVTVENSPRNTDELEVVEGMRIESGMMSPFFSTNEDKVEAILEKPYILFYNNRLTELKDMIRTLENVQKEKRSILLVVDEIDNDILSTLTINKVRAGLKIVVVKAPGAGQNKSDRLEDFAIISGGTVITDRDDNVLSKLVMDDLGTCEKVIVTASTTTIISGAGSKEKIDNRINQIKELQGDGNQYMAEIYQKRLGVLSGGVAILRIGAPTETELNEKKDRVDDSLAATRAAVEEGIVIGGGCALLKASKNVDLSGLLGDELIGAEIVIRAIQAPVKQIASNAGFDGGVVANKVMESDDVKFGFDAASDVYGNMFDFGIIDPTKVERVALEQAVSVASLLLTSEVSITQTPRK